LLGGCSHAKDTSTGTGAGDAQSGTFSAIDIPVYPGSTVEPDKSVSMDQGGNKAKIDYYLTKDDAPTVIAWYKAQLPSNWTNADPSDTTSAAFASPGDAGNQQGVVITGGGPDGTEIQLATKTSSGS